MIGETLPSVCNPASPHPAHILAHHRLTFMAAEGVRELGHIGNNVIYPEAIQRMGIAHDQSPHHLGTHVAAPHAGVAEKKSLQIGNSVLALGIEIEAFIFQVSFQRRKRQAHSTVVGGIFT
jgi:hypothetical protein